MFATLENRVKSIWSSILMVIFQEETSNHHIFGVLQMIIQKSTVVNPAKIRGNLKTASSSDMEKLSKPATIYLKCESLGLSGEPQLQKSWLLIEEDLFFNKFQRIFRCLFFFSKDISSNLPFLITITKVFDKTKEIFQINSDFKFGARKGWSPKQFNP